MKKYVIGYDEQCLFICKTRADAEEMILSIAEENAYENWYIDNCADIFLEERPYQIPAEYITPWALALRNFSSAYWIDEVEELE